jgi:hypothetical protein
MDDSAREAKVAHNEYLLKRVNRRIDDLTEQLIEEGLGPDVRVADFLCACGSPDCHETIRRLSLDEYERIRVQPHRFIVLPGHDHPDLERTVERHAGSWVVEKLPAHREAGTDRD